MKKWFKGLAALALAINMMPALSIKAEEELNLDGESAVLIDADSGAVLYEKNADVISGFTLLRTVIVCGGILCEGRGKGSF